MFSCLSERTFLSRTSHWCFGQPLRGFPHMTFVETILNICSWIYVVNFFWHKTMCITVAIKPHKTARLKFQQQHFRDLKGRMRIATCPSIPKFFTTDKCCALDVFLGPVCEIQVHSHRVLHPSSQRAGVCIEMPSAPGHLQGSYWKRQQSSALPFLTAPAMETCSWGVLWSDWGWRRCLVWRQQQKSCKKPPRLAAQHI